MTRIYIAMEVEEGLDDADPSGLDDVTFAEIMQKLMPYGDDIEISSSPL